MHIYAYACINIYLYIYGCEHAYIHKFIHMYI
jgi:4-diphosphocytidyl-2C-methyl-D-erythritol kinase